MPNRCRFVPFFRALVTAAFSSTLSKNSPLRICLGDAHRLLIDDPPGPDVLVPDLAVAHRPFGQADVEAAGVDQRVRILGHQPVGDRMLREVDGVGVVPLRVTDSSPSRRG